jgi:hypothetical protein
MGPLLALVAVTAAAAVPSTAAAVAPSSFLTPSHGIGCALQGGTLRCDVRAPLHPRSHPAACDLDFGDSFVLGRHGRARWLCHGDTVLDPRARVLRYGQRWRRAGRTCTSRRSGLTCRNGSGHGFRLSRQVQRRF